MWFYEQGFGVGTGEWEDFDFYLSAHPLSLSARLTALRRYFGPFPKGYTDKYIHAAAPLLDRRNALRP